jgi:FkbM family methyltransferase
LYDLVLTEVLWRLLRPGNTAIDVGANIGYMTTLMASRVGETGTVLSIEPHPQVFAHLQSNVALLRSSTPIIQLFNVAISDRTMITELSIPKGFSTNQGTASLSDELADTHDTVPVQAATLDELMTSVDKIDLVKIDVEGHEYEVLLGGLQCIKEKGVTHVLFEDHPEPPTRVTELLMDAGFSIFYLSRHFWGPRLIPLESLATRDRAEAPNYLATRAGAQVMEVMSATGWRCLR